MMLQLLRVVAHVGLLKDFVGWTAHLQLHLDRMVEQRDRQLTNLRGHGGREHHLLAVLGQQGVDLHDVVREAHVEHAVGLVEHEERGAREVEVAHLQMTEQTTRRGDDHRCSAAQALHLLVEARAVVAAIDGNGAHPVQIVGEALHGLVYLLGQFACGCHDHAVDGIFWIAAVVEHRQDGQQVGCRLARACLCHADDVASVEYLGDTLLLYGCHLLEVHVVECIEDVVVQDMSLQMSFIGYIN